ncbi:type II toxin-antitoxin system RelB/DinJ family antitoxin [Roseateles sp. DB2]|uniref:type II toxin-antitoxin system RelB/DinJ family antitoxin n=1 Tax=Roseateles sp. DB2 TaxID=3453717 RepID=UPI003EEE0B6E
MNTLAIKSTDVRSRVEPELKDSAVEVLAQCGLSLSDAIRLFLHQVVAQNGLPFEVKAPNAKTIAAMEEARSMSGRRFDSGQELLNDLEEKASKRKAH